METDILIVGSGCAGLYCALQLPTDKKILIITKDIVENSDSAEALNGILHSYGEFIIGRMGIPYRKRGVNIISVAVDAPQNKISALAGQIGNLAGVNAKIAYSNVIAKE